MKRSKLDLMIIRPAQISDAAILGQLLAQLGYPARKEDCILRIQQYSKPDYQLWVGDANEQMIGFIALHDYYPIHHPKPIGRVIGFCVEEKYRGKGYGTQLLNFAEDQFKMKGCFKVELTSNLMRTESHEYYFKRGYHQRSLHVVKLF